MKKKKLTHAEVVKLTPEVIRLYKTGIPQTLIKKKTGVSCPVICETIKRYRLEQKNSKVVEWWRGLPSRVIKVLKALRVKSKEQLKSLLIRGKIRPGKIPNCGLTTVAQLAALVELPQGEYPELYAPYKKQLQLRNQPDLPFDKQRQGRRPKAPPFDPKVALGTHQQQVAAFLMAIIRKLEERRDRHDQDLAHPSQQKGLRRAGPHLWNVDDLNKWRTARKAWGEKARRAHFAANSYYPASHGHQGLCGMTLLDLLEWLCDKRSFRSGPELSLEIEHKLGNLGCGRILSTIITNTMKEMGWGYSGSKQQIDDREDDLR